MKALKDAFEVHRIPKKDITSRLELIPGQDSKMIFDVYIMGIPRDVEKFLKLIEKI